VAQNLTFNLGVETGTAVSEINKFFQAFDQGAAQASGKLRKAFSEPLKTEVEISLKNGELVAKKIESTKSKTKQLKDVYKALNGEIGKTPNKLKQQMSILKALQGNTKKYQDGTNKLSKEWKLVEDRIRRVKAEQDRLTGSSGGGGMDNFIGKFALVQTAANLATSAIMSMGRAVGDMAAQGVRLEMLMLQLEAFTGGAQQAEEAYKAFGATARQTPFNVEEVANAGKIMMAFGVDTGTAVEMTDRLAIAAAATGGDINNLGRNLGQISAQGQAYTRDLHQFAMQGLPIWDEMSKVTGKSVVELKKLATEGKISFEIVSAAIKNMTQEGSSFAEVAERMQETFAGRLASIETSFANLSLAVVDAFNQIDAATGKVVTGAMKQFADFLQGLADSMPSIATAVADTFNDIGGILEFVGGAVKFAADMFGELLGFVLRLADPLGIVRGTLNLMANAATSLWNALEPVKTTFAFLVGPAIVIGIGLIIKSIYGMMTATYAYIKAQIISLGLMGPKGWAIMVGAGMATAAAFKVMESNLREANAEMKNSTAEQKNNASAAKENADAQGDIKIAVDDTTEAMKRQRDEAKLVRDDAKKAYNDQKKIVDDLKESIKARYDQEIEAATNARDRIKEGLDTEKDNYKQMKDIVKDRYDEELQKVTEIYDKKLAAMDLERDKLSARGPKEQELYMLEKEALQNKIKSGELEGEELLRAEARLERMNRQEKLQKLAVERKKVEAQKAAELKKLEDERDKKLEDMKIKHDAIVKNLEAQLKTQDDQIDSLKDAKGAVDEIVKGTTVYNGDLKDGVTELDNQVGRMNTLKGDWDDAIDKVEAYNRALKQTPAPQSPSGGGGSSEPTTSNFAGGPIAAGTTSWVNELGKEAFLSASGKLSMINDKHGKWTAPSDGTIIPAHLTKKLDIPTGGVNINRAAASNASRAGAGGMGGMVRAIAGAMSSGDVFNQSVTVQAANPVQAANNMMVEMTRMKRRRLGR